MRSTPFLFLFPYFKCTIKDGFLSSAGALEALGSTLTFSPARMSPLTTVSDGLLSPSFESARGLFLISGSFIEGDSCKVLPPSPELSFVDTEVDASVGVEVGPDVVFLLNGFSSPDEVRLAAFIDEIEGDVVV